MKLVASGSGTAPTANTILAPDYLRGQNDSGIHYTIPAFDSSVDADGDNYLNDAEWNNPNRNPNDTARFLYQTRLVTGYPFNTSDGSGGYGPMRVVTNPNNSTFANWVSDYEKWHLGNYPASGLYVDNSFGQFPQVIQNGQTVTFNGVLTAEQSDVTNYASNYATLLKGLMQTVGSVVPNGVVVPNTGGGTTDFEQAAGTIIAKTQTSLKEKVLQPLNTDWYVFEKFANNEMKPQNLDAGGVYTVLGVDLHGGLEPSTDPNLATDPQAQLTALAEYYLLADPYTTFLQLNDEEHTTSWTRSWLQAAAYDVGQPLGAYTTPVQGVQDPANTSLTYRIYQRQYTNALVLYRPLSNDSTGNNVGKRGDNSTSLTPYNLGGSYYVLEPDGSLERNTDGSLTQVSQVSMANGQGFIFIKAAGVSDAFTRPDGSGGNLADLGVLGTQPWTAVDPHSLDPGPGTMNVVQVAAGTGVQVTGGSTGTFATSVLSNINIQDVALEADVKVTQDADTDLIARYQSNGFYEANLFYTPSGTYQAEIWRDSWNGTNWVYTPLAGPTSVNPVIPGTTHHLGFTVTTISGNANLVFVVDGQGVTFVVGGQNVTNITDTSPLPAGAVGIRGSIGDTASPTFLNFVMIQPQASSPAQEVYFTDDFARMGTQLSSIQPLWNVQGNNNTGYFDVSTGAAVAAAASGQPNYVGGNALIDGLSLSDVVVQADVNLAEVVGNSGYVLARYSGSSYSDPNANYYEAGILQDTSSSEQVYLFRVGQYYEQFGPVEISYKSGQGQRRVRLEVQGTNLRVYVDNVLVISEQDTTKPAMSAGKVGFRSHYQGVTFDNFQAAALGASGAFSSHLAADQFPGTSLSSAWTVMQGYFTVGNSQAVGNDGGGGRSVAVSQGTVAADVSVSATVTVSVTGHQAGVIAGYQDAAHYYMGVIEYISGTPNYLQAAIYQLSGNTLNSVGTPYVLEDAVTYYYVPAGTPIHLTFEIVGTNLYLSVAGYVVVQPAPLSAPVPAGEVGILAYKGETVGDFSSMELDRVSNLLYADHFDGPATSISAGSSSWWNTGQGNFTLSNGQAVGNDTQKGRSVAVVNGIKATNVSLSVTVTVPIGTTSGQVGLIAGYQDANDYYAAVIRNVNGQLEAVIVQDSGGIMTDLKTPVLISNSLGLPLDLGFTVSGNVLTLYVNGTQVMQYTASASVPQGSVGIYADWGEILDDFIALSL